MKLFTYLASLLLLFSCQFLNAQEEATMLLDKGVVQSFEFEKLLQANAQNLEIDLLIEGEKVKMNLEEVQVVTPDFKVYAQSSKEPLQLKLPKNFKGKFGAEGKDRIYLTVNDDFLSGVIHASDKYYSIQNIDQRTIGMKQIPQVDAITENYDLSSLRKRSDDCLEVVISTMNTFRKFVQDGSNPQTTMNHNIGVVLAMENWYEDFNDKSSIDVSFVINEVQMDNVFCEDHFRLRNNALECFYGRGGTTLDHFDDWINSNSLDPNSTGFNQHYDVATLWLSSTEGLSGINGQAVPHDQGGRICDDRPFNFCKSRATNDGYLQSHEVGHNLGATDLSGGSTIMAPGVSSIWANFSVNEIEGTIENSCLNITLDCGPTVFDNPLTGSLSSCCKDNEAGVFSTLSVDEELIGILNQGCDISELNFNWRIPFGFLNWNKGFFGTRPSGPSIEVMTYYIEDCEECQSDNPVTVSVEVSGGCLDAPITLTQTLVPCCGPPEIIGEPTVEAYADENGCLQFNILGEEDICYETIGGVITGFSGFDPLATQTNEDGETYTCIDACAQKAWMDLELNFRNDCGESLFFKERVFFPECFGNGGGGENAHGGNDDLDMRYCEFEVDLGTERKKIMLPVGVGILSSANRSESKASSATSEIDLFPNPANNQLQIKGAVSGSELIFKDALGRTVKNLSLQDSIEIIDVSDLTPGAYFLIIHAPNGQTTADKIIINR